MSNKYTLSIDGMPDIQFTEVKGLDREIPVSDYHSMEQWYKEADVQPGYPYPLPVRNVAGDIVAVAIGPYPDDGNGMRFKCRPVVPLDERSWKQHGEAAGIVLSDEQLKQIGVTE